MERGLLSGVCQTGPGIGPAAPAASVSRFHGLVFPSV